MSTYLIYLFTYLLPFLSLYDAILSYFTREEPLSSRFLFDRIKLIFPCAAEDRVKSWSFRQRRFYKYRDSGSSDHRVFGGNHQKHEFGDFSPGYHISKAPVLMQPVCQQVLSSCGPQVALGAGVQRWMSPESCPQEAHSQAGAGCSYQHTKCMLNTYTSTFWNKE